MNKTKWIESNSNGIFKDANKDVIHFIANVLYDNTDPDEIYDFFANGHCYYFALMLKDAFNRGTICWHRNHGHIVWVDDNNVAYDIGGVYDGKDLLPVETSLGDLLVDFKHVGKFSTKVKEFKDWCDHYNMTELYAISDIYKNMPKYNDHISVQGNALFYWMNYKSELSEYYNNKKEGTKI